MTNKSTIIRTFQLSGLFCLLTLTGCASAPTTANGQTDSWEGWNRGTQSFNDTLDNAILKPLAKGYQTITPEPVDQGITNFFGNINDIGTMINDLFQLKLLQSGLDFSRFLVNTTVGVAGIFDVAQKINLPKHNEDFGQTLGFWGVPAGNYLVLPFFGPSSPRDTVGLIGDALLNPLTYVSAFGGFAVNAAVAGSKVVDITDTRADLLSSEKILDEAAIDRYEFIKNSYEQRREYLIHDGNPPEKEIDDPFLEDEITGGSAPTGSQEGGNSTVPVTEGGYDLGEQNKNKGPAPVLDNSRHILDLSAPK